MNNIPTKWKRTSQGGMLRQTDRWIVNYPPYQVTGTHGRLYTTTGVARFHKRDEARKFVKVLREKRELCLTGAVDDYITQLPLPEDEVA